MDRIQNTDRLPGTSRRSALTPTTIVAALVALIAVTISLIAGDASAFRLIQVSSVPGTYTSGARVTCGNWFGYAHWGREYDWWYLNTARQGSGKNTVVQNSLDTWEDVTNADYRLHWGGTTTRGVNGSDLRNVLLWTNTSGFFNGGAIALTILTTGWWQEIVDVDIVFDNRQAWSNARTQDVATHELGHGMGIHHTNLSCSGTVGSRPTMCANEHSSANTLRNDDRDALRCIFDRYRPANATQIDEATLAGMPGEEAERALESGTQIGTLGAGAFGTLAAPGEAGTAAASSASRGGGALALTTRLMRGGAILRYALDQAASVELKVYDIAGRSVATLVDGSRGAGEHEVAWNGEGTNGRASAGVYFARLRTSAGVTSSKIVLAR